MHRVRQSRGGAELAAALVAFSLAAGCAGAGRLSASELVARNAEARGGRDAWRKVETMVWTGHVQSAHAPAPSMPFTLEQKRPNKTRMEISAPGEKFVRVYDGSRGWRLRVAHGRPEAQPFTPQEVKFAQAGHGLEGPLLDAAARGTPVTLEGVDKIVDAIGEREAYHLILHPPGGSDEDVWLDTQTCLEIRFDRMADGPAGAQRRISTTFGDYHSVDGLKIPFVIETGNGPGSTPDKLLLDSVALNPKLDDSSFENPAAPHLQHRGPPAFAPRRPAPAATASSASADNGPARR